MYRIQEGFAVFDKFSDCGLHGYGRVFTPVLRFADQQTAEKEEHVARNHRATFHNCPEILQRSVRTPKITGKIRQEFQQLALQKTSKTFFICDIPTIIYDIPSFFVYVYIYIYYRCVFSATSPFCVLCFSRLGFVYYSHVWMCLKMRGQTKIPWK